MRYLTYFLLSLILYATPIKIATYNVENLFDASFQGTEYEEYIPGKHNWNKRMVDIKLNHIAEVICDLNADIIGLQEIENKIVFNALQKKLKRVGCAYKYSAITEKKGAPIQVALLSQFPLKKHKDIQVSYAPKVRNILEVEVEIKGVWLTLFVNHWKSKAYKGYESKRIKYAKALQARITKLSPRKEYIILGDFNSDYNAYLTLDDKLDDTHGYTAFNDVLKTKIGKHLVDENDIVYAPKGVHYSLWHEVPLDERWSHKFYGKKSTLDHIVLPRQMFDGKGIDYVNNSFKVFKADYLFTKRGYINRWRFKNGKHMAKGYSDHLPIFAYFDTKPYAKEATTTVLKQESRTIESLYANDISEENQILLEDSVVIFKRGRNAIIKQKISGRGIFLYGCAEKLKEGYSYDLLVEGIKSYHGLREITHAYIRKKKSKVKLQPYYERGANLLTKRIKQNEVVRGIKGVYKKRHLWINGYKFPIYFKKSKFTPKNGSRIKIDYAHLGYYKKLQLVVYSPKDFTVLE